MDHQLIRQQLPTLVSGHVPSNARGFKFAIFDGEPKISTMGFHIDPNHGDRSAQRIARFLQRCREEPDYWESISQGGIDRVNERYTWRLYAERMMTLSRVYGFWKHVSGLKRTETRRHLEMFYALQYRPLAAALEAESDE